MLWAAAAALLDYVECVMPPSPLAPLAALLYLVPVLVEIGAMLRMSDTLCGATLLALGGAANDYMTGPPRSAVLAR